MASDLWIRHFGYRVWMFTGISSTTSIGVIISLHVFLFIGISMVWTPAQTNGLNQLPPELYPHGTAVMSTLQQVTGAIGTAVAISLLTSGTEKYLHGSSTPTKRLELENAMTLGSQHVFLFTMVVSLIGLVIAFFVRRVIVKQAVTDLSQ